MFDFTDTNIYKMIIHGVGNRFKDEGIIIGNSEIDLSDNVLKNLLLKYFLTSFREETLYRFSHEANIKLNEIYNYVQNIFEDDSKFYSESVNILKHLYDVSKHPKIKRGELYVVYFKNCKIDDKVLDAIGIFKSENKETYLKVANEGDLFNIQYHRGVNVSKLDKGCLILNYDKLNGYKVAIVDTVANNEAIYWKDDFLNVGIESNEYTSTKNFLSICSKFTNEIYDKDKKEKMILINDSIEYFKKNEDFNIDNFINTVIKEPDYAKKFKEFIIDSEDKANDIKYEDFSISAKAVENVKRSLKNFIKLDTNIEIRINSASSLEKEIIEKGYDVDKKMQYYKIYFNDEK